MADTIDDRRTVMQPHQAQKRQLRRVKKLSSLTAPSGPTSANEPLRQQARVRQQRADQTKKQPALPLAAAAASLAPPRKVVIARLGQAQQRGVVRAFVSRVQAGTTVMRPDKVVAARSAQKAQLKSVRMSAMKATTSSK
jgi:hypothetical protein